MSNYKKELIKAVATALKSYGYTVFLSKNQEYGFYTNGKRVVTFGGPWRLSVDFSGNYKPSARSGTGWQIAADQCVPTAEEAHAYITANAPQWTGNTSPVYTTPEQHLATYGSSSGYTEFMEV